MIWFVGAGSGAVDLITVRGQRLLRQAELILYAGSLVNPQLLEEARPDARIYNTARMTLEEVVAAMIQGQEAGFGTIVRLHTGDPSLYGAIREQMDQLRARGIPFQVVPGVSSFSAAAAALEAEYTLPGVSQTLILTRMAGRTPVPEAEDIRHLAHHGSSMAVFLSAGMLDRLQEALLEGAYTPDTPAALVYKASWPEEQVVRCTLGTLAAAGAAHGITQTALVLVGDFLGDEYCRSLLYHPDFTTQYRQGRDSGAT